MRDVGEELPTIGFLTPHPNYRVLQSLTIGLIKKATIGFASDYQEKPSTPWSSRAVPQPSTDLALHRLAMEFEWDPACSMQYGRRLVSNRHDFPD